MILDSSTLVTSDPSRIVTFPRGSTSAWPEIQPVQAVGDPRIFGTIFQDVALFHPELSERICLQADTMPANMQAAGGKKVRDADTWNMVAAQLLTWRALMLYCVVRGVETAHVLDRWANVMTSGDYSTPHCHYDAEAAVVYSLDPGEIDAAQPMNGEFEIIDPRIAFCCPYQAERPIRGLVPKLLPGTMLVFPAEILHHVRPYHGERPRLTLAWNISAGLVPPGRVYDPTQPVPFKMGKA